MNSTIINFVKDHIYIFLGVLCIVIIGIVYMFTTLQPRAEILPQDIIYTSENNEAITITETIVETVIEETPRTIMVHIIGEVNNPGVLELPYGSRVHHALELAGGGTAYANLSGINLVSVLRDAMQIRIPAYGEDFVHLYEEAELPPSQNPASGLVNINTATLAELQTLPNIGPVIAQRIIDFRETQGNFATVDDLIRVSGIGDRTLEGLRSLVKV